MVRVAANLDFLFKDLPFPARFMAARAAGFEAVEYLFPYQWPITHLENWLKEAELQQVLFNTPPGDWGKGERGLACLPDRVREFRDGIDRAIDYALWLKVPRLHIMAGLCPDKITMEKVRATFVENLIHATNRCHQSGITAMIEPINPYDMPGYFLHDFGQALELISEIRAQGAIAPRLQFDIYHCARIHGNVSHWITQASPVIEHFQIAGIPDRHEPDYGNLALGEIIEMVDKTTANRWIGCEYSPRIETTKGLGWIIANPLISF
jgi:hydroxypyruvate isomerase